MNELRSHEYLSAFDNAATSTLSPRTWYAKARLLCLESVPLMAVPFYRLPDGTWQPQNPTGYAYECVRAWHNPQYSSDNPTTSIPVGARGKVIQVFYDGWIDVSIINRGKPWTLAVPRNICVFSTRKFGDYLLKLPKVPLTQIVSSSDDSRLRKAIDGILQAMRYNIRHLQFLPRSLKQALADQQCLDNIVNSIYDAVPDSVKNVLNQADFTIMDLAGALESGIDGSGIYVRIYSDWKGLMRGEKPAPYVGKTKTFQTRHKQHLRDTQTKLTSNHYRYAKLANAVAVGPLVITNDQTLKAIAEQIFVMLFFAYCQEVLNYQPSGEFGLDDDLPIPQAAAEKMAKHSIERDQAVLLTDIAKASFRQTGWHVGTDWEAWGGRKGLNWASPISDYQSGEKIIWTKISYPQLPFDIYRRQTANVLESTDSYKVFLLNEPFNKITTKTQSAGHFAPVIGRPDESLCVGTRVYASIEIMRNGKPHPRNWSRLPLCGPFEDWDQALSWAIKLEWQLKDSGKWRQQYLSTNHVFKSRKDFPEPGVFNSYLQGIAVYRYFKQLSLDPLSRPKYQYDYGTAIIKVQQFSWLEQTVSLIEQVADPNKIVRQAPKMSLINVAHRQAQFELMSFQPFGVYQNGCPPGRKTPEDVEQCDSCFLDNLLTRVVDSQLVGIA